ncbi:Hydrogenobyrinic acid a,c-diamide synthase (glutamine-hydrolyzing) [hydrothermal vent metagenome]|uniref:Hydrogenobyrinic acid a,c-diamide synthase (Glutamine-hydrolyzing) n=1 Tax=hydrothermal vent metagenome TaxID=652676 RepID=A0A3B0RJD1_9ZZZZ
MANGIIIAAPSSGSGKTVVTLSLLAALRQSGVNVASAKVGPDYIDPCFHSESSGRPCLNLDQWAMRPQTIAQNLEALAADSEMVVIEGVMGLFDGPEMGKGSTADLAAKLNLPVILVVNCSHQAQSVAALVKGFAELRDDINLAGVILNWVSSERHTRLLKRAVESIGIKVIGAVPRVADLQLPSRHLGLVQANEHPEIKQFVERAGQIGTANIDLHKLISLAKPLSGNNTGTTIAPLAPLGQRIAIARDEGFGFFYPHLELSWQAAGAEIIPFSPLANEAPDKDADAIFLPGGYPELHGAKLAANSTFLNGLRTSPALIYGECGGYMVLGDAIIDKDGNRHAMAGLLPVTTSFATRKLTLGYRTLSHNSALPWPKNIKAHEFHYSTVTDNQKADALFSAEDTTGKPLGPMGLQRGKVMGSYAHIIDQAPIGPIP